MMQVLMVLIVAAAAPASVAQAPVAQISAQQAAQVDASVPAKGAGDASKMVCVREQQVGSRLKARKVCKTQAEWDFERQEQRRAVDKVQAGRWKSE